MILLVSDSVEKESFAEQDSPQGWRIEAIYFAFRKTYVCCLFLQWQNLHMYAK